MISVSQLGLNLARQALPSSDQGCVSDLPDLPSLTESIGAMAARAYRPQTTTFYSVGCQMLRVKNLADALAGSGSDAAGAVTDAWSRRPRGSAPLEFATMWVR